MWGEKSNYKIGKCHFLVKKRIALDHLISKDGIKVDKAKNHLIVNFPTSTCVKQVRYFLGYVGLS